MNVERLLRVARASQAVTQGGPPRTPIFRTCHVRRFLKDPDAKQVVFLEPLAMRNGWRGNPLCHPCRVGPASASYGARPRPCAKATIGHASRQILREQDFCSRTRLFLGSASGSEGGGFKSERLGLRLSHRTSFIILFLQVFHRIPAWIQNR